MRIDIFWFGYNSGEPIDFYMPFWEKLAKYNYRLHWGKYLAPATSAYGPNYLSRQYPHWVDFLKLRQDMDPNQIFVTQYWRGHLAIPPKGVGLSAGGTSAPSVAGGTRRRPS